MDEENLRYLMRPDGSARRNHASLTASTPIFTNAHEAGHEGTIDRTDSRRGGCRNVHCLPSRSAAGAVKHQCGRPGLGPFAQTLCPNCMSLRSVIR